MADQKSQSTFDWEKSKSEDPMLQSMPELVAPGDLSVEQSARFSQLSTFCQSAYSEYGVKASDKNASQRDILMAESAYDQMVLEADKYFKTLAKDPKAYEKWTRGRSMPTLMNAFAALILHYGDELGK